MSKKSKSKWKKALWVLVAVAFVCIVFAPVNRHMPRLHWQAPVHVAMPRLSTITKSLPDLPEIPKGLPNLPSMPKIGMPDVGKLEGKIQDKVEGILTEIPPFPYEVLPKKDPEEVIPVPPVPVRPPPAPTQGKGARIAIIIDDMGLVPTLSERAVRLPAKITLAYLPYAPRLQEQTEKASAVGHDLMLHLPMEPVGGENPGPHALYTGQSEVEWKGNLDWALNSFEGYIGVNNHMGSKFTSDARAMAFVSHILQEKGVFFVDSRTNAKSVAQKSAHEAGVRAAARDVFLDDTPTVPAIRAELAHVERVARQKGLAIAIGHPHAATLGELEQWLPDVQARGYEIVPVRQLVE